MSSTIGDAPALLDTIQALANSISNDPNYSNTIVADLALKLNIADFNTDIANYVCTLTNLTVDTSNLIVLTKSGNAISLNYTNLLTNLGTLVTSSSLTSTLNNYVNSISNTTIDTNSLIMLTKSYNLATLNYQGLITALNNIYTKSQVDSTFASLIGTSVTNLDTLKQIRQCYKRRREFFDNDLHGVGDQSQHEQRLYAKSDDYDLGKLLQLNQQCDS